MGNYGFKVSKPGYAVENASVTQQVFNSELNQLKVKTTGTTRVTSNTTIAHGESYTPVFFGLYSRDGNRFKMGYGGIDGNNILLTDLTGGSPGTYWRYYIFYHQAV